VEKEPIEESKENNTFSVIDNRTGKSYTLNIKDNCISALELSAIKDANGTVTRSFDPAYMNTVVCESKISFINGDKGVLEYRGIPIRQLAEKASLLETYFLIIYGELPQPEQLKEFTASISSNYEYDTRLSKFIEGFTAEHHC
jgi:citrate synthase